MVQQQNEKEIQVAQAWAEIRDAYRNRVRKHVLSAQIIGAETLEFNNLKQESLKVYFEGIYGYIPKTLIDDYEYRSLQSFIGSQIDFIVTHVIDEGGKKIFVGDRKAALNALATKFWKTAVVGQEHDAFVSGVDQYGAYLVINGVRTRINREDFSHTFHMDLREVVFIGDIVPVKLVEVDKEAKKIEVSRKVLETDPREYIDEYQKGGTYFGTIVNVDIDNGIFVKLEPRGLIARTGFPPSLDSKKLVAGEKVNVKVTEINLEKARIRGILIIPGQGQLNKARGRVYGR